MKICICKETVAGETRVAAVPETVRQFRKAGWDVAVQAGAGEAAMFRDADYAAAGAAVVGDARDLLAAADVVLKVQPPDGEGAQNEVNLLRAGSVLVALLAPAANAALMGRLAAAGVAGFSMDAVPRIARAQVMDALSSMSMVAGYKAVLLAADRLARFMPMMITAAGTIRPAGALVIGAGVAGLQAIATARRLGGNVKAIDTRPAAGEQVESLGAKFVPLQVHHEQAQDEGGYARDLGEAFYRQEQELIAPHLKGCDVLISTALIPNRRAPVLVTADMVRSMPPGSVIVDVAAPAGGNCSLTRAGQWTRAEGVDLYGPLNLPAEMPTLASQLYARNVAAFLAELIKDGQANIDLNNEVIRSMRITHEGQIVHEPTRQALQRQGGPA